MRDGESTPERSAKRPAVSSQRARRRPASAPSRSTGSRRPGRRALRLASAPFRLWSAFCVVAFVLSLFGARLVQLQGVDENDYAAMAAALGSQTIVLDAPRAPITDRFGVQLAQTVDAEKLVADPTYTAAHARQIAAYLHHRISADYLQTLADLRRPGTRYVILARSLSPLLANSVVDTLDARGLGGVYTEHDTLRVYPAGDVAGALVGFTGSDGGLSGIEASYNSTLSGQNGRATYQVVDGQILPLGGSTVRQPVDGSGVRLTIDSDLQFLAQRQLAAAVNGSDADSGSAVVMVPRTGQILALADYPTYNPNDVVPRDKRLLNPASVTHVYEPGSVEKLLTFSGLIDAGYVTPRTKVVVPPLIHVDGHDIHDYFAHAILHLTAAGVIAKSSNLGMIRAAADMPNGQLYRYLHKFGIGEPVDVGIAGTNSGILSPPSSWSAATRDNIDFGQGLSVTAVQMAAAVSAIANGGEYVAPSLVAGTVGGDGTFTPAAPPARHRVVSPAAAHAVARMMETVLGPDGTAPQVAIPGYTVAGKTGTAQVAMPGVGYNSGVYTVSFAGFAPAENPRVVVYVVIHHPRAAGAGGGVTAGPVVRSLLVSALEKYGVRPTPGKPQPLLPVYW